MILISKGDGRRKKIWLILQSHLILISLLISLRLKITESETIS